MDDPTPSARALPTILLADDSLPFRRQVRNLLRKTFDIELLGEAADGEEAVRLASELKPDIVIMDVAMPLLNGIEATRRIKNASPSIQVIALSMHGDAGFRQAMQDAGASIYLLKDNVIHKLPKVLRSIAASLV